MESTIGFFSEKAKTYDAWYEKHRDLYILELELLRSIGCSSRSIDVGAGTGRFTRDLGILFALEPAAGMASLAKERNLDVVVGIGEAMPVRDSSLDCSLIVVTICFVDDARALIAEASRVGERVVACIVPRDSTLGAKYAELGRMGHPFYSRARFLTVDEVVAIGRSLGLSPLRTVAVNIVGGLSGPFEGRGDFTCVELRGAPRNR